MYILKGKRNYTSHIYQNYFILYEPICTQITPRIQ